eukprot:7625298-Pyramimonas_sp.AAC.1
MAPIEGCVALGCRRGLHGPLDSAGVPCHRKAEVVAAFDDASLALDALDISERSVTEADRSSGLGR